MEEDYKIGYEIKTLDNLLFRNFLTAARYYGVDEMTVMHGWILGYLCDNPGKEIFQRDIETQFSIGRSSVTGILTLMEKKGYIKRARVSRDARLKKLLLTENGRSAHLKTREIVEQIDRELVEGLTEEELRIFAQVIAKVKANSERQKERYGGRQPCESAPCGAMDGGDAQEKKKEAAGRGGNDD